MITKNKLDKSFGPVGTTAGIIIFFAGVIETYFSLSGLILILIGALFGFTSTSTLIDSDKKRIKFSNDIFGIIKIGQWIGIEPGMKIGIKKSNLVWRAYSWTNRTLETTDNDYRLILFDSNNKKVMEIKKTGSFDSAKLEQEKLINLLGL
jgi:hypothetical protein